MVNNIFMIPLLQRDHSIHKLCQILSIQPALDPSTWLRLYDVIPDTIDQWVREYLGGGEWGYAWLVLFEDIVSQCQSESDDLTPVGALIERGTRTQYIAVLSYLNEFKGVDRHFAAAVYSDIHRPYNRSSGPLYVPPVQEMFQPVQVAAVFQQEHLSHSYSDNVVIEAQLRWQRHSLSGLPSTYNPDNASAFETYVNSRGGKEEFIANNKDLLHKIGTALNTVGIVAGAAAPLELKGYDWLDQKSGIEFTPVLGDPSTVWSRLAEVFSNEFGINQTDVRRHPSLQRFLECYGSYSDVSISAYVDDVLIKDPLSIINALETDKSITLAAKGNGTVARNLFARLLKLRLASIQAINRALANRKEAGIDEELRHQLFRVFNYIDLSKVNL